MGSEASQLVKIAIGKNRYKSSGDAEDIEYNEIFDQLLDSNLKKIIHCLKCYERIKILIKKISKKTKCFVRFWWYENYRGMWLKT